MCNVETTLRLRAYFISLKGIISVKIKKNIKNSKFYKFDNFDKIIKISDFKITVTDILKFPLNLLLKVYFYTKKVYKNSIKIIFKNIFFNYY